ncbi:DUF5076 domain-containing protein [Lysobacter sp. MMG2]|uniref:DUF5076 domain-containing protein n=1 Tax=Lysobacter sp. MMG2 TaxID=2801338 RepID=UPI001C238AAB|nr:DUF5076 domain-containing protein [Lysobacter sp. MMG2]MBU8976508.1 DUF5076 domain-containing protein [Lysobacter sp. MMG2]
MASRAATRVPAARALGPEALAVPAGAREDPAAFELLRLWAVDRRLAMSVCPRLEGEPADFGVLLADLFSHACEGHARQHARAESDVRASMFLAFACRLGELSRR